MEPRERDGAVDYRIDSYHHRLTLTEDTADSVEALGWKWAPLESSPRWCRACRIRALW